MKRDLKVLKTDIDEYLESEDFGIFHGFVRISDPTTTMEWDVLQYPDFRQFLALAKRLGVAVIGFHHRELDPTFIDDLMDQLETGDLEDDVMVEMARRLQELRVYEGFTCSVDLTFWHEQRLNAFSQKADWYAELLEIADELDEYSMGNDFLEEENDMGQFFSRN